MKKKRRERKKEDKGSIIIIRIIRKKDVIKKTRKKKRRIKTPHHHHHQLRNYEAGHTYGGLKTSIYLTKMGNSWWIFKWAPHMSGGIMKGQKKGY